MLKRRNIKKLHTGISSIFFYLRSETALYKDGGVEALSHVEDQQVGAIIQRPLATHVSLSINFGSYSQRKFKQQKHKSRLQILPSWLWGIRKSTKVHISVPKYLITHLWVCWVDHLTDISVVEAYVIRDLLQFGLNITWAAMYWW